MAKRLTAKAIRYVMNQLEKGKSASEVAAELGVIPRHIRRLRAKLRETGSAHVPLSPGRPALPPPSQEEVQLVLDSYKREEVGVLRTAISLRIPARSPSSGIHTTRRGFTWVFDQTPVGQILLRLDDDNQYGRDPPVALALRYAHDLARLVGHLPHPLVV